MKYEISKRTWNFGVALGVCAFTMWLLVFGILDMILFVIKAIVR